MNLVIMAAGMGSRFGGLKQLTPIGPNNEFLIDYSIYDAIMAGVKKVIFVIREEHLDQFRDTIGRRIEQKIPVSYAFQKITNIPIALPKNCQRKKPWGTGQALLTSEPYVDDNFMIINADDFYGRDAFLSLANFFKNSQNTNQQQKHYAMVAYQLKNTLSQNGTVSRGICEVENHYLKKVTERTKIAYQEKEVVYEEEGKLTSIDKDTLVSVNLYGFTKAIFQDTKFYFQKFLQESTELSTQEFYLPSLVQNLINDNKADITVLTTTSQFNGMTYKEDLEGVKKYINTLIEQGVYPQDLWRDQHEK